MKRHLLGPLVGLALLAAVAAGAEKLPPGRPSTVAELLGFAPHEKLLIIHADDVGMCHAHNRATIDGMEKGLINSGSIMIPCPWILEIIQYANAHPQADFGVHLVLNCEWKLYRWRPVAPWDKVKSLLDPQGYLWPSVQQTVLHATPAEVEAELRAQVRRAIELGLRPTHLDTHMGAVFARPEFFAAYRRVASEFRLPCLVPRLAPPEIEKLPPEMRAVARQIHEVMFEAGEVTVDHLDGGYPGRGGLAEQKAYYAEAIRRLKPGITQIILHPAYDTEELQAIAGSHARRYRDFQVFTDPEMAELLRQEGIRRITWREIGQRQAAYQKRLRDQAVSGR